MTKKNDEEEVDRDDEDEAEDEESSEASDEADDEESSEEGSSEEDESVQAAASEHEEEDEHEDEDEAEASHAAHGDAAKADAEDGEGLPYERDNPAVGVITVAFLVIAVTVVVAVVGTREVFVRVFGQEHYTRAEAPVSPKLVELRNPLPGGALDSAPQIGDHRVPTG